MANQKFIIRSVAVNDPDNDTLQTTVVIIDNGDVIDTYQVISNAAHWTTESAFMTAIKNAVVSWANGAGGYTGITTADVYTYKPNLATVATTGDYNDLTGTPAARSFNFNPGRSIVTGTGATGFQVSSTRDSFVTYSPKIVTTATIAGGQDGYVVLEIAPTNSATAGDWKEVGRMENGQALSLAITLQSVQPVGAPLVAMVPAGYYAKLRSVNVTGTPTISYVSGQEVLL